MHTQLLSPQSVLQAAECLAPIIAPTPVLTHAGLNEQLGYHVFFKCENLQRTGAFKFRGAYYALSRLSEAEKKAGVVTYSSGNHGRALAHAARLLNIPATILMPEDAPTIKQDAARQEGAEVILFNRYQQSRELLAAVVVAERGLTLIPPFAHLDVIAGQGTATLELFQQVGPLDTVLVCLGGGGLLSGAILARDLMHPECEMIGVEPAAGNDIQQSLQQGEIVTIPVPNTIADGAQTQGTNPINFSILQRGVKEVLTVSDEALKRQMRWFAEHLKLMVEPTGCLAAAALPQLKMKPGSRVGVIVSGGNVDLAAWANWVGAAA